MVATVQSPLWHSHYLLLSLVTDLWRKSRRITLNKSISWLPLPLGLASEIESVVSLSGDTQTWNRGFELVGEVPILPHPALSSSCWSTDVSTGSHLVTLRMEPRAEDGNTEIQKEAGFLIILWSWHTHLDWAYLPCRAYSHGRHGTFTCACHHFLNYNSGKVLFECKISIITTECLSTSGKQSWRMGYLSLICTKN